MIKYLAIHHTGERNARWKGGKSLQNGYISSLLQSDSQFFEMAGNHHYVKEHRLVMAKHIGRCLHPWEVVHHVNGIKADNRIDNLKLLGGHEGHNTMLNKTIIQLQRERDTLRQMVTEFCAERVKSAP